MGGEGRGGFTGPILNEEEGGKEEKPPPPPEDDSDTELLFDNIKLETFSI